MPAPPESHAIYSCSWMPTGDVLDHKSCLDGVAFINDEDFFKKTYTFMNSSSGWPLGL